MIPDGAVALSGTTIAARFGFPAEGRAEKDGNPAEENDPENSGSVRETAVASGVGASTIRARFATMREIGGV